MITDGNVKDARRPRPRGGLHMRLRLVYIVSQSVTPQIG